MVTGPYLLIAFVVSVAILLFLIIKMKVNPFIALLFSSIVTALGVQMPLEDIPKIICAGFGGRYPDRYRYRHRVRHYIW